MRPTYERNSSSDHPVPIAAYWLQGEPSGLSLPDREVSLGVTVAGDRRDVAANVDGREDVESADLTLDPRQDRELAPRLVGPRHSNAEWIGPSRDIDAATLLEVRGWVREQRLGTVTRDERLARGRRCRDHVG